MMHQSKTKSGRKRVGSQAQNESRLILGRAITSETEYGAVHVKPVMPGFPSADSLLWYGHLVEELHRRMLTCESFIDPQRLFLANGGSIAFECNLENGELRGVLAATSPECASPYEAAVAQAAQDALLADVVRDASLGTTRLAKTSLDEKGRTLSRKECYECNVATGFGLCLWRSGVLCLLPLLLIYKVAALVLLLLLGGLSLGMQFFRSSIRLFRHGQGFHEGLRDDSGRQSPAIRIAAIGLRLLHQPLALGVFTVTWLFAFRKQRRILLPFLASRIVIDGAGRLDERGIFWLSSRAGILSRVHGLGGYWGERCVFDFGQFLEVMLNDSHFSFRGYLGLFKRTQRLSLMCADSTPNAMVEYLRFGATSLILDLADQNWAFAIPRLERPLDAFMDVARDHELQQKIALQDDLKLSPLEIQNVYLEAVRKMLSTSWHVPSEAWSILEYWEHTLSLLSKYQVNTFRAEQRSTPFNWNTGIIENSIEEMQARFDWMNKLILMNDSSLAACVDSDNKEKDIDFKYHELADDSLFNLVASSCQNHLALEDVERAKRLPPVNSLARHRAYFIREFSTAGNTVRADWNRIEVTNSRGKSRIRLR